jgi:hypothetical protein
MSPARSCKELFQDRHDMLAGIAKIKCGITILYGVALKTASDASIV